MKGLRKTAVGAAVLLTTTLAAVAASDNYVYFTINGATSFSFPQTAYSITQGEEYGGTTSGINKGQPFILVKADRKKSKQVADWFKDKVGTGANIVCKSDKRSPSELNFAVEGTFTMQVGTQNIQCPGVVVAQGNEGLTNNWWMGSRNWAGGTGNATQSCTVAGGGTVNVTFRPTADCVNNFTVEVK